jgi:hypothetical protein
VNDIFSLFLILSAALGPGYTQLLTKMSIRSRIMFLGSRALPVRRADKLARAHIAVTEGGIMMVNMSSIGRTADFGRWFPVAQWSDASRRARAVTLFGLK